MALSWRFAPHCVRFFGKIYIHREKGGEMQEFIADEMV
jgi:hypothetical protein